MTDKRMINAATAPASVGGYSQAVEVSGSTRRLYISGQIPATRDGHVPARFKEQAAVAWQNVAAQLAAADMSIKDLVKVTIFLADRTYALENREARGLALGTCAPAQSVVIAGIFDAAWLLEIEAIAEC